MQRLDRPALEAASSCRACDVPRSWSVHTRHDRGDHRDQQDQKQATARPRSHREEARRAIVGPGSKSGWRWLAGSMASRDVEEVVTRIWRWERRPRGLRPSEFGGRTSYAVAIESELLLLDPLLEGDQDPALVVLDELVGGRARILVTMPYHTRSSESLWRRYAVRRHESMGIQPSRLVSATSRALRPSPAEVTSMASLAFTRSGDHPARSSRRARRTARRGCLERRCSPWLSGSG